MGTRAWDHIGYWCSYFMLIITNEKSLSPSLVPISVVSSGQFLTEELLEAERLRFPSEVSGTAALISSTHFQRN